jgi:fatty-acyl-CoA synthase
MLLFMSQQPGFATADLSSLATIVCGGAPVPEPLLRLYAERGVPINQGYGLTETSPFVTFLAPEWGMAKLGSTGRTPLFSELADRRRERTHDHQTARERRGDHPRPERDEGLLEQSRGDGGGDRSAEGWFHTGDIGYLDEDGFLFIADRLKDMVITGGENVYPAEVESALYDHPAIAEIAVIGLPDDQWGEAVVAVAALKPGAALELDELRDFGTERLARYKLPRRLELVPALPRNPAGKVLKFELRARFGGAGRQIG